MVKKAAKSIKKSKKLTNVKPRARTLAATRNLGRVAPLIHIIFD